MARFRQGDNESGRERATGGRHFAPKGVGHAAPQTDARPAASAAGARFSPQQPRQAHLGRRSEAAQPAGTRFKRPPQASQPQQAGSTRSQSAPPAMPHGLPRARQAVPAARPMPAPATGRPAAARPAAGPCAARTPRLRTEERPRRSARDIVSYALIGIGLLLLIAAGGIFIHAQLGYKQSADAYKELERYAVLDESGDGIPQVDFDALWAINEDVVAWLYIPGTGVNYPVLQGETNDTYLRALMDGTWNAGGSIFMDEDGAAPGMVDQQTTVYGHHMNDGSMFKVIHDTLEQGAFDGIEVVYYITPESTYACSPLLTSRVPETYGDARVPNFTGETSFSEYLNDAFGQAAASAEDASERISSADKVLTLVTCVDMFLQRGDRVAMICTVDEVAPRG